MRQQTFGRDGGEVLPRSYFLVHGAGWVRNRVFNYEHCCTVPFAVSGVDSLLSVNDSRWDLDRFLMAQSQVGSIVYAAWIVSTFPRPPSKRAVAIAFINSFSQLGNVAGSYVWPKRWGPTYRYSYGICIATNGLAILVILSFRNYLKGVNEKAGKEEKERGLAPGYRYLL